MDIRRKQIEVLKEDVTDVLSYQGWISSKTNKMFDTTRILGILAIRKGAEDYIPYTIPKVIEQISETGTKADIIIGLNNGFECPAIVNGLASIPKVRSIHLYTGEKRGTAAPSTIFANERLDGRPYCIEKIDSKQPHNRLFFVHQREGIHAAGKIRVLIDIYQLLLDSTANGWLPPAFTLTLDAESFFLKDKEYGNPDLGSNGLKLLIERLTDSPEIDILGAKNRFAVYGKQTTIGANKCLIPDFNRLVPPIQSFLNLVHGRYSGFSWKPGGGTIGKTDVMISLLITIAKRYPGSKIEDAHATILAQHAGFRGDVFTDVVCINRCPDITDVTGDNPPKLAWIKQMSRWISASHALEKNYGRDNIRLVAGYRPFWMAIIVLVEFLKGLKRTGKPNLYIVITRLRQLLSALRALRKIKRDVLNNPDLLSGYEVKGFW